MKVIHNGWCCTDCIMLLANGEYPLELNEEETLAYKNAVQANTYGAEVTIGRLLNELGCKCESTDDDTHRNACGYDEFSTVSCDVCGTKLAGTRHAVTFWQE